MLPLRGIPKPPEKREKGGNDEFSGFLGFFGLLLSFGGFRGLGAVLGCFGGDTAHGIWDRRRFWGFGGRFGEGLESGAREGLAPRRNPGPPRQGRWGLWDTPGGVARGGCLAGRDGLGETFSCNKCLGPGGRGRGALKMS